MDKRAKLLALAFIILFVVALIVMIAASEMKWEVIILGAICGGYGIKRMIDDSMVGYVLVGLCILLMVVSITGFDLNYLM